MQCNAEPRGLRSSYLRADGYCLHVLDSDAADSRRGHLVSSVLFCCTKPYTGMRTFNDPADNYSAMVNREEVFICLICRLQNHFEARLSIVTTANMVVVFTLGFVAVDLLAVENVDKHPVLVSSAILFH